MRRPGPGEYADYYGPYVDIVPRDRSVIDTMAAAPDALDALLAHLPAERETFAYAPGKWSAREVLGHVIDAERLFAYRALHIARGDVNPLPGMDQDAWAANANAAERPLSDLLREFRGMRDSNAALFASFDDTALARRGVASGVEFTVRALVHVIAGHELHHRAILRDRYLSPDGGSA